MPRSMAGCNSVESQMRQFISRVGRAGLVARIWQLRVSNVSYLPRQVPGVKVLSPYVTQGAPKSLVAPEEGEFGLEHERLTTEDSKHPHRRRRWRYEGSERRGERRVHLRRVPLQQVGGHAVLAHQGEEDDLLRKRQTLARPVALVGDFFI